MKPLSDFYSRIQPFLVGCPEPTINQALVDSAIRFCEDSQAIHERTEPFLTRVGVTGYDIDAPTQQRVTVVREVFIDGVRISSAVGENIPSPNTATGKPSHYYASRVGGEFLLQLYPAPDAQYSVVVDAAYAPVRGATTLDDDLFDLWSEAMVMGTVSKCASIPNQAFTDLGTASAAGMAFSQHSAKARREAGRTRIQGSDRVRPRQFI